MVPKGISLPKEKRLLRSIERRRCTRQWGQCLWWEFECSIGFYIKGTFVLSSWRLGKRDFISRLTKVFRVAIEIIHAWRMTKNNPMAGKKFKIKYSTNDGYFVLDFSMFDFFTSRYTRQGTPNKNPNKIYFTVWIAIYKF